MSMKILGVGLLVALAACSSDRNVNESEARATDVARTSSSAADSAPMHDTTSAKSKKVTVLFFGTSLTAGYGLDPSIAFPNLIAKKSLTTDTPIEAINAGLSGETSAGAVRRIEWALRRPVDVVVIETGGNDALRALDPDSLEANLEEIVTKAKAVRPQARILLAEMESPPNLGVAYTSRFRKAYSDVAKRHGLTLVPFLLDKVAGRAELNQADGVHPNERGEPIVADNVWKVLEPVVRDVYRARELR
jgi:acyl-CoA thioesterase-1